VGITTGDLAPPHAGRQITLAPALSFGDAKMKIGGTAGLKGIDLPDWIAAAFRSVVDLGVKSDDPPRLAKPIRLCNAVALMGLFFMTGWAIFEATAGDRENLPWEIGLVFGFAACMLANGLGHHRIGRFGMLFLADGAVFVGTILFQPGSGGSLPFIAMAGLPFLLFDPSESILLGLGTLLAIVLFAWCEGGVPGAWLHIHPRAAPSWYFAANAATAFGTSFLIPLVFYRANARAEADLEHIGNERLRRLIDSSIIGVGRGYLGGPIVEANAALLELLGYTREDVEAGLLDLGKITPPEYADVSRRAYAILTERGYCPAFEKQYFRKDGSKVPVLVGLSLLDPITRETVGFVLDISEKKQLEHEKHVVREKEEAVRLRDLFNSIASHELKTPLSALVLQLQRVTQAMEKGTCAMADSLKLLHTCEVSAKKLGMLVEELFDLARITQGRLALSTRPMDLAETTRTVVTAFEASGVCAADQIKLHADAPVRGEWDPIRIEQVVTNLVSNAIKYGAGKPVDVLVAPCAVGGARLEIADRGMGIDRDMLTKIFDPFQRAVSGKHIQGLGLGLFVVKSIVEAHGGTVHVESQRGAGSTFVVELPRECVAELPHLSA
jgi:PAS domain S-box-containing protein